MKKTLQSLKIMLALFFVFTITSLRAQSQSIYESYAILSINGGTNAFYDLQANTPNPDFQATNLGSFTAVNSLVVKGGQNKTVKCNGGNTTGGSIYYRVSRAGTITSAPFTGVGFTFVSDDPGAGAGCQNQSWTGTSGTANLLTGLSVGNYTLEIYSQATGTPSDAFASNGGNNYKATFSVTSANKVDVFATGGPATAGYTTLQAAINAINAGTHSGTINVAINASTTELGTSVLNSSGAGSANYTSINIFPTADGLTVSGASVSGRGLIELNGADNVTIDGDNPNSSGINRNLTFTNTATSTTTLCSVIRLATSTAVTTTDNITIKNCILNGNATARNASGNTSTNGSENNTSVIYAGGNGGTTATTAPAPLTSINTNTSASGQTFNNLVISNNAINQAAKAILLNGAATSVLNAPTITNNLVGAPGTAPTTTIYTKGIYLQGATSPVITGNTVQNIQSYVPTLMTGIELNSLIATSVTVSTNIVTNVIQNSSASTSFVHGISIGTSAALAATPTLSLNTVSGVQGYSSSISGQSVAGILYNSSATSGLIEKNTVSSIYNNSADTYGSFGISLIGGNSVTVSNNMVRDITHNMTGGIAFTYYYSPIGILVYAGTGQKIYHNSVSLSGLMPGAPASSLSSFALAVNTSNNDIRNNIFSNTITGGTTNIAHTSVYFTTTVTGITLNNNTYYSGADNARQGILQAGTTPGTNFFLASNFNPLLTAPSNNSRSFTAITIGSNTNDNASYASTNAAPFISATNLHLDPNSLEVINVEQKGATGTGINTDIDGDARPNAGTTNPDIGADEIALTILANDAGISAIPTTAFTCGGPQNVMATVKNYGSLPLTSVKIDWKVNAVAQTQYASPVGFLVAPGATTTVTLGSYNFLGGTPNTITATTSLPNGLPDAKPSNDSFTSATFTPSLSGTYTVGVGKNFATLTAAVAAANSAGLCGATVFSLTDATYAGTESFPIIINSLTGSSATNTLTIKPAVGISPTISGAVASNPIFTLNGGSNIFIDGSNAVNGITRDLTFANTSTTAPNVILIGSPNSTPITNVIFKNSIVNNGSNGSTAFYLTSSLTKSTAGYFNNVTIQNNSITKAYNAFFIVGNTAANNGDGVVIKDNMINGSGANAVRQTAISISGLDGNVEISDNTIQNVVGTGSESPVAILLATGMNKVNVFGNSITNVNTTTGSSTADGIIVASGSSATSVKIYKNIISGISSNAAFANGATGVSVQGATANVSIYDNQISNIKNTNTTASGGAGIYLGSSSGTANTIVYNNMIWDVAGYGSLSVNANGFGIYLFSGAGYKVYSNSVNMTTNQTTSLSAAIYIHNSITTANSIDIRNNIFANNQTANTRYAIYSAAAKTVFSTIDYNDYFSTGVLGFLGTDQVAITDWQTATSKDANSLNVNPPFILATNLHLSGCTSLESGGTPIAGITTDIDADTRNATTPDIGADEFTGTVPLKITAVTDGSTCGTGTVSLSAVGATGTTQYLWYDAPSGGTLLDTNSGTFTTPSISVTTTYYVAASDGSCIGDIRKAVVATVNPTPSAISLGTTPASALTACDLDYVKLDATGGFASNVDAIKLTFENGLNDDISGTWTKTNLSTGGTLAQRAAADWSEQTNGYVYSSEIFNSNDLSKFGITNSDATKTSTVTTATELISPAFSLVGYSSASLSFYQYYRYTNGSAKVQISTDGGLTWTAADLASYTSTDGSSTSFNSKSINLNSYVGQSNVKIRFKYTGSFAWYWAVDNIKVSGDKQQVTWFPATDLYTDSALMNAYTPGTFATTVYAAPDVATSYTASATNGICPISSSATASIEITKKTFTANSGNWDVPANWSKSTIPTATKCVNIPADKVVNVNIQNAEAKSVYIAQTGQLTIQAGNALKVKEGINIPLNNGTNTNLIVESDANLLQVDNVTTNNNTGIAKVNRYVADMDNVLNGPTAQMDYVYWGSPVTGQGLQQFSPGTPANRIYQYRESNDRFYAVPLATEPNFLPAKGYAIRAEVSATFPENGTGYNQTYVFNGVPNNGDYSVPIVRSANGGTMTEPIEHGYNLVGNPYPSNIVFNRLFAGNSTKIKQLAYFWTNNNFIRTQQGNDYVDTNYAIYNGTGGSAASGTGNTTEPDGNIKVGQGFIIQKLTTGNASLDFKNSYGTGQELRTTAAGTFYNKNETPKDRFWLQLISQNDVRHTQLIGYVEGATNGLDVNFDAEALNMGSDLFYSKLNDKELVIQGRSLFSMHDKVQLGANYYFNGNYTIGLKNAEGIFANGQVIYLKDNLLQTYTNLQEGTYTFNATKGISDGRFEIVYKTDAVLGTDDTLKNGVRVYRDANDFVVRSSQKDLKQIEVFEASGRLIYTINANSKEVRIDSQTMLNGIYIVKARLKDDSIVTVKVRK